MLIGLESAGSIDARALQYECSSKDLREGDDLFRVVFGEVGVIIVIVWMKRGMQGSALLGRNGEEGGSMMIWCCQGCCGAAVEQQRCGKSDLGDRR